MKPPVTVYIIGYNEEENLRALLPTVTWADEILYVDSFSTDNTAALCAEFGVRRVDVPFAGFGKLRNRALELAGHDWVVSIDTDERCTPEFVEELAAILPARQHAAYFVPRKNTFLGRHVHFCGMYPDYRQPQVFDRTRFRYREEVVHEGFECDGTVGHFKNPIWQHPFPTLSAVMKKNERYTTLMARRYFASGRRSSPGKLLLSPLFAFLKKYLLEQGFREGIPGILLSGLHAQYTFLKYAKLWELQRQPGRSESKQPSGV